MQHSFIIKQKSPALTLFFTGWGMDSSPFNYNGNRNCDLCVCYDYTSLSFDPSVIAGYHSIRVVAWSMGVWAASQILENHHFRVSESLAINGTPYPVDDMRGIPTEIFRGTLNGLNERNLQKFYRRMSGSLLTDFLSHRPRRNMDSLTAELAAIQKHSETLQSGGFAWQQAIAGRNDLIFPVSNQLAAWQGVVPVQQTDDFHFMNFEKYLFPDISPTL